MWHVRRHIPYFLFILLVVSISTLVCLLVRRSFLFLLIFFVFLYYVPLIFRSIYVSNYHQEVISVNTEDIYDLVDVRKMEECVVMNNGKCCNDIRARHAKGLKVLVVPPSFLLQAQGWSSMIFLMALYYYKYVFSYAIK